MVADVNWTAVQVDTAVAGTLAHVAVVIELEYALVLPFRMVFTRPK